MKRISFPLTTALLALGALGLLLGEAIDWSEGPYAYDQFQRFWGASWSQFWHAAYIWQPLTFCFVFAGPLAGAIELGALFLFGRWLEPELGAYRLACLFLISGWGGLFVGFLTGDPLNPIHGMQGALSGLSAAAAFCFPRTRVALFRRVAVPLWTFALLTVALLALIALVENESALVNLGGMAAGALYASFALGLRFGGRLGIPDADPGPRAIDAALSELQGKYAEPPAPGFDPRRAALDQIRGEAPAPPRAESEASPPSSTSDKKADDARRAPEREGAPGPDAGPGEGAGPLRRLHFDPETGKFYLK